MSWYHFTYKKEDDPIVKKEEEEYNPTIKKEENKYDYIVKKEEEYDSTVKKEEDDFKFTPKWKYEFPNYSHIKSEDHKKFYPKLEPLPNLPGYEFPDISKPPKNQQIPDRTQDIIDLFNMKSSILPPIITPIKPYVKINIPTIQKKVDSSRIGPAKYDALQIHGHFGLIHAGTGWYNEDILVVHTPNRQSKEHMLSLKVGDEIYIVRLKNKTKQILSVRYVSRYKYFSPGQPITMLQVGVDGWE